MLRIRFFFLAVALVTPVMFYGQSALDGFNPNANGAIRVVFVQPDGKILIGGLKSLPHLLAVKFELRIILPVGPP